MTTRLNLMKQLYDEVGKEVLQSPESWEQFLSFAAKIWKHSFVDALLIYKQRPDATLVADMDTWNKSVGRWIIKGTKSIAVINDVGSLHYMFDVSDIWSIKNAPSPKVWKMTESRYTELLERSNKAAKKEYQQSPKHSILELNWNSETYFQQF